MAAVTAKLLVLFEYASINGGENSFLSVLHAVRAADFEVIAAVPHVGELIDALRARNVTCEPFDASTATQSQSQRRSSLAQLLRRVGPHLVHANSLSMSRLAGPVVTDHRIVSVGHLRDIMRISPRAMRDVNKHTRLLAVSAATKAWHVAAGLVEGKTHILYNGVDVCRFAPQPRNTLLHDELGIRRDANIIGGIGQLGMRKGWDILLQAFMRIAGDFPSVHVVLIGQRHANKPEAIKFVETLKQTARNDAIAARVHFLGRRHDVPELLPQFTILVHPAREEPLGRVLLEAGACGIPVVATRVGGTEEVFPSVADAAVLVEPDAVEELAQAVRGLLRSSRRRDLLGANARRRVLDHFDAETAGRQLVDHYCQLLDR